MFYRVCSRGRSENTCQHCVADGLHLRGVFTAEVEAPLESRGRASGLPDGKHRWCRVSSASEESDESKADSRAGKWALVVDLFSHLPPVGRFLNPVNITTFSITENLLRRGSKIPVDPGAPQATTRRDLFGAASSLMSQNDRVVALLLPLVVSSC